MKAGDRVVFSGRVGTVVRSMPGQMIDIKFDDAPHRIERRSLDRLERARTNPSRRRPRRVRAHRNPSAVSLLEGTGFNTAMLHVAFSRLGMTDDEFVEEAESLSLADRVKLAQSLVDAAFGKQTSRSEETVKREQAEKERSQESAAKRVKPKTKAYALDLESKLGRRSAVTVVESDPLRVSDDRSELCGNPIDGHAYYLLVSTQRRFTPTWIKQADVYQAARLAGVVPDKTDENFLAWVRTFFDSLTENNVDWYAHRQAVRQAMRVKGMGLPAHLARKEASAKHPGTEPNDRTDFWLPDTDGTPVFFRINQSENPGAEALKRFQLYASRRLVLPSAGVLPAQLVQQYGTLATAMHLASQSLPELEPRGIAPELCRQLIVSGCVRLEYRVEGGRYARKEQAPELDPNAHYMDGAVARIYAPEKAANPLFSWVRSHDPVRQPGDTVPKCLSAVERDLVVRLRQLDSTLGQLDSGFGHTRTLFARLVERPDSLRVTGEWQDVFKAVARLSRAYTAVLRWWGQQTESAALGDVAAARALEAFSQTVLQPTQPSSVLNMALTKLRSGVSDEGGLLVGLAPADWMVEVVPGAGGKNFKAKLERRVAKLQQGGYEAQIANAMTGAIQYRVPLSKVKPEITDHSSFHKFMQLLDSSARAELMPASAGSPGRPGMAALTYLAAATKKRSLSVLPPDPVDDLYMFIGPSLSSDQKERLLRLRQEDNDTYRAAVSAYAIGGVRTQQGLVDPLDKHEPFFLMRPAAWPVSFEQQLDVNWAIGFVIDQLLPLHGHAASYEVLLLTFLYDLLFGYELAGPLRPDSADESPHLIQKARAQLRRQIADLLGGSRGLAQSGRFEVYKTYNPVLFEATRQSWPDRQTGREVSDFTSILASTALADAVDTAGHYGFVVGQTQRAALMSDSVEGVQQHLTADMSRVSGLQPDWLLNRLVVSPNEELLAAPAGYYNMFFLSWRLGQTVYEAGQSAHAWTTDPLEYIASVKPNLERSVSTALAQRRTKVGRLHEDLPFLYPDVGIPAESAVHVSADDVHAVNWRLQAIRKELERRQKENR